MYHDELDSCDGLDGRICAENACPGNLGQKRTKGDEERVAAAGPQ